MEVRARPAVTEDLPQLQDLHHHVHAELVGRRGGAALAARLLAGESPESRLLRSALGEDACLLAGTLDGVVVGLAGAVLLPAPTETPRSRTVEVDLLFVSPPARRVGVASELLGTLTRWASARGCTEIDAPALPGDRALKALFESYGLRTRLLLLHGPLRDPDG